MLPESDNSWNVKRKNRVIPSHERGIVPTMGSASRNSQGREARSEFRENSRLHVRASAFSKLTARFSSRSSRNMAGIAIAAAWRIKPRMKNPIIAGSLRQMNSDPFHNCFGVGPLAKQRDKLLLPEQEGQTGKQFEMLFRCQAQEHEESVYRLPVKRVHLDWLAQKENTEDRRRRIYHDRNPHMGNRYSVAARCRHKPFATDHQIANQVFVIPGRQIEPIQSRSHGFGKVGAGNIVVKMPW